MNRSPSFQDNFLVDWLIDFDLLYLSLLGAFFTQLYWGIAVGWVLWFSAFPLSVSFSFLFCLSNFLYLLLSCFPCSLLASVSVLEKVKMFLLGQSTFFGCSCFRSYFPSSCVARKVRRPFVDRIKPFFRAECVSFNWSCPWQKSHWLHLDNLDGSVFKEVVFGGWLFSQPKCFNGIHWFYMLPLYCIWENYGKYHFFSPLIGGGGLECSYHDSSLETQTIRAIIFLSLIVSNR